VLRLLTDEHISPAVAAQAPKRCRGISITSMQTWQRGHFLSAPDEPVLQEAHKERLTLVTFDCRTIPPLLRRWAEDNINHSGVILIDERTIAQHDIGGIITAICALWRAHRNLDWTNRVLYLQSAAR
jgi:hypothetical protein